jgi:hypothetical protein
MKTTIISAILLLSKFELIKILLFSVFKALIPVVISVACFGCGGGGNCNDPYTSTSSSLASGVNVTQGCGACVVSQWFLILNEKPSLIFFCFNNRKQVQVMWYLDIVLTLVPLSVPLSWEQEWPVVQIEIIVMKLQIFTILHSLFSAAWFYSSSLANSLSLRLAFINPLYFL